LPSCRSLVHRQSTLPLRSASAKLVFESDSASAMRRRTGVAARWNGESSGTSARGIGTSCGLMPLHFDRRQDVSTSWPTPTVSEPD